MSDLTYEYPAEVVMQRARETRAMMDENARMREALERLEKILSPEAMRGDTVIDDAYDLVFRTLAALESGARVPPTRYPR